MSKPVLIIVSVLMVMVVGFVKPDRTPIRIEESAHFLATHVRVTFKVEVNPISRWDGRTPGLACAFVPVDALGDGGVR